METMQIRKSRCLAGGWQIISMYSQLQTGDKPAGAWPREQRTHNSSYSHASSISMSLRSALESSKFAASDAFLSWVVAKD